MLSVFYTLYYNLKQTPMSVDTKTITQEQNKDAVISYLLLRQFIGILGIMLPLLLTLGTYILANCNSLQPSISHYYYSIMHIVFVGVLCVMGGFLITYRGASKNRKLENRVSNLAGACALGVAICPTKFAGYINPSGCNCQFIELQLHTTTKDIPNYINSMHFGFAAVLFTCFVFFCMSIFQDPDLGEPIDDMKKRRNVIYKTCGVIIIISILCIAVLAIFPKLDFPYSTFIFETTALLPFGFSWLLKGSVNWPESKNPVLRKAVQYLR